LVINRITLKGLKLICGKCRIASEPGKACNTFHGSELPRWDISDGLWVPTNSYFPGIDFFVKRGSTVFGFQVHVGAHHNVAPEFFSKCAAAGWFSMSSHETLARVTRRLSRPQRTIVLIYLSPNDTAKDQVKDHVQDKFYSPPPATEDGAPPIGSEHKRADDGEGPHERRISLSSLTCSQISGLKTLSFH
jgi:hypothetical protein